jgi:Cdc6-like AAA superfamily ATPase
MANHSDFGSQLSLATKATVELLDKRQIDREQHENNQSILERLSKTDFSAQQSDFIRRRHPGTGEWLLKSAEFQDWIERTTKTLFCPGIPGAGKTIMAATVIDELYTRFQEDSSACIVYFYCNFRRHDQPEDLLLGLLKQLAQHLPTIPDMVKDLYNRITNNPRPPSLEEISRVLHNVISMYTKVFIVIDALDELAIPERKTFLSEIFDLEATTDASLFITSRFILDISRMFEKRTCIEIRASDEDVSRYLDGSMSRLPSFVQSNPELEQDIKAAIITAVDGM